MHPVCNEALKKNCKCGKEMYFCILNTKHYYGYACVCLSSARTRDLFIFIKRNRIDLSIGKILEETLVQSAFQQTLGDTFTFQQDNNLRCHQELAL